MESQLIGTKDHILISLKGFRDEMKRASDLVIRTFASQGHQFLKREGRSLLFKRDGEMVRIYLFKETVTQALLDDLPPGRKVVVCLSGWAPDIKLPDDGSELWDRDRFYARLGESVFEAAMSASVTSHIFTLSKERRKKGGMPEGKEEGIVANNVSPEKAQEIGKRIEGFKHELRLIPWYILDLVFTEHEKERPVSIAVDALTGKTTHWNSMLVLKDDIAWPQTLQEPKVSADEALAKAIDEIASIEGKRSMIVKKDYETVTVVDRVRTFDRRGVRLIRSGLFHFPIWVIEGVKGIVIINGFTGDVIEESFLEDVADDTAK
jgi:hypothetical protein